MHMTAAADASPVQMFLLLLFLVEGCPFSFCNISCCSFAKNICQMMCSNAVLKSVTSYWWRVGPHRPHKLIKKTHQMNETSLIATEIIIIARNCPRKGKWISRIELDNSRFLLSRCPGRSFGNANLEARYNVRLSTGKKKKEEEMIERTQERERERGSRTEGTRCAVRLRTGRSNELSLCESSKHWSQRSSGWAADRRQEVSFASAAAAANEE